MFLPPTFFYFISICICKYVLAIGRFILFVHFAILPLSPFCQIVFATKKKNIA
jgi:hypothetical protein